MSPILRHSKSGDGPKVQALAASDQTPIFAAATTMADVAQGIQRHNQLA